MADGKTIKIKDILKNKKYRVFTKITSVAKTPTEWFRKHKVPIKHRFSFMVTPMTVDDLDMIKTYKEYSDYQVSFERSLAILNKGILDVWKFKNMSEYMSATPKQREKSLDADLYMKIMEQQSEDFESKLKAKKIFNTGRGKIVMSCTKEVFIGKDTMEFTEENFENLDEELKDFLYKSIMDESILNDEDILALR